MHELPDGRKYIGATSDIKSRCMNKHSYNGNKAFFKAINEFGWENIKHTIICENLSYVDASQMEIELIAKYQTTNPEYGFNIQKGGRLSRGKRTPPIWSKRIQKMMVDRNMNKKQLAKEIGCNYRQLINVLSGTVYQESLIKAICTYFGMEA